MHCDHSGACTLQIESRNTCTTTESSRKLQTTAVTYKLGTKCERKGRVEGRDVHLKHAKTAYRVFGCASSVMTDVCEGETTHCGINLLMESGLTPECTFEPASHCPRPISHEGEIAVLSYTVSGDKLPGGWPQKTLELHFRIRRVRKGRMRRVGVSCRRLYVRRIQVLRLSYAILISRGYRWGWLWRAIVHPFAEVEAVRRIFVPDRFCRRLRDLQVLGQSRWSRCRALTQGCAGVDPRGIGKLGQTMILLLDGIEVDRR